MEKVLVVVTGISAKGYGLHDLTLTGIYEHLKKKYTKIIEIDYQPILDKHAMCFKSLLDPVRYVTSSKSRKVRKYVEETINKLSEDYDIDLLTHSLGGWILEECKVKVNTWFNLASAVGWFLPIGRSIINVRISNPNIEFNKRYWVYSEKDLVSCSPPINHSRFSRSTEFIKINSPHDLSKYLVNNIVISRLLSE